MLSSVYYIGKFAMSKQNSDTRVVLTEKTFLHIFGRKFVDAVNFAMEMCKYKYEQLQVIYYLSRWVKMYLLLLYMLFAQCLRCFVIIT